VAEPVTDYLLQGEDGGSCCALIALLNARRYYGEPSPEVGVAEWEALVDIIGCRYGSAIAIERAADTLGLEMVPIRVGLASSRPPAMLTVFNPEDGGFSLHSVLAIGGCFEGKIRLVNYRWVKGPVVEDVPWESIGLPSKGNPNRECWHLKQKKALACSTSSG